MENLTALASYAAVGFAASWLLTSALRRYALTARLLDQPNERTSHTVPTPRGGGVAIVGTFLAATTALWLGSAISEGLFAVVLGSGLAVSILGFVDDHRPLPARWRFLGHTLAAGWFLWWIAPLPRVPMFGAAVDLGLFGTLLAAVYLVWSINLFNFMDGIDGIASIEAITVSLGGAFIWWLAGSGPEWIVAVVFAACVAGFLVWNFPPARIFMGDAGSGFLGLIIATLSLWCGHTTPHLFWCWFILGGTFMVDATTTLVRRVRRGEKASEAHRSHAYQYAARKHRSHKHVSLAFGLVNLVWLLPIAVLVALGKLDGVVGVIIAYTPLVALAFRYKAGDRAAQEL